MQHWQAIPRLFSLAGYLHVYKWLPYALLKKPNLILRFAFSPISDEDYALLKKIVADTDSIFLQWAIKQILLWRNNTLVKNMVHIHGTADKLFPFSNTPNTIAIPKGGHFMIYNRANEISELIRKKVEESYV